MQRVEKAWQEVPLVWLAGVRRAGKTVLAKEFNDSEFLNCDLPGEVWRLEDPEAFFKSVRKPLVVLDEVHQLPDPSRILKIATDAFPHLRVLATGSSTLAASRKFRDTLTGRKRVVALTPVLAEELRLSASLTWKRAFYEGATASPSAGLPRLGVLFRMA